MTSAAAVAYARAAGVFLILTAAAGWYGELHVPAQMMTGEAASTAARLRANEALFRLGFAAYMVEAISDVTLLWLFYVLLRPVNREFALLSAFFGLVSMTLFAVTQMFYFAAPSFLSERDYFDAFTPEQLESFASIFLGLSASLSGLFMLFYGLAWMVRGWLTFRSRYLPRFLGVAMCVAGLGFFARNATKVLAPQYASDLLLAPMFLAIVGSGLWLLIVGVSRRKWDEAVASTASL